jgi:hypothetical protein
MANKFETAFNFREDFESCLREEGLISNNHASGMNKFFDRIERMGKKHRKNKWLENVLMVLTDMLQWQIVLHLEEADVIDDSEEEYDNVETENDAALFEPDELNNEVSIGTRLKLWFDQELTFRLYFDITRSIYQSDEQLEEALQDLFSQVDDQL